jgi:F-type H+-transporting ATPase subunit b
MIESLLVTLAAAPGGSNPFTGAIYQSIAAATVFVLLLVVLKKLAWGPILKGLQDREHKIRADLEYAERASRESAEKLKQYERQLADAQAEAGRMIAAARTDAEKTAAQIREATQNELNAMKVRATMEIRSAKEDAINQIYTQAATLSTQIASQILKRQINAQDQQALVEQSLAELRKVNQN